MLSARIRLNLNRLTLSRACSTQNGGESTSADKTGLTRFLDVVKDTHAELNKLESDESSAELSSSGPIEQVKFTKLFRHSDLVKKGFIKNGFLTQGTITHSVDQTIFIDYGGKFPFITRKPDKNRDAYVRGAKVLVKILDWELTARFIGMDTDSTLCESEGRLVKLLHSPWIDKDQDTMKYAVDEFDTFSTQEIEEYLRDLRCEEQEDDKFVPSTGQKFKSPDSRA